MTSSFEIKWKGPIQTQKVIQQLCHQSLREQFSSRIPEIGPYFQELLITYQNHSWTILKNEAQLQQFVHQYNDKFDTQMRPGQFISLGINQILKNPQVLHWKPFHIFFELEDLALNKAKSIKLQKKCGGRHRQKYFCCNMNWLIWKQRNFVITTEGIMYYENEGQIKEYLPFDNGFEMLTGDEIAVKDSLCIMLVSNHRNLEVRAKDHYTYIQFLFFIKKGCVEAAKNSAHRFESFAPERANNQVQFKVDGQEYFKAVAHAIQSAQNEVFIAGWWVSPEFNLIRPCNKQNEKYRVDRLLKYVADKQVKVYVLVYYESSFLTNDSLHTKEALQSLSSNIKVVRHPLGVLPILWSHHEKIIVVDQAVAFLGGLDLCYGRFDCSAHRIDDNCDQKYPGIEYNNVRIKDLMEVKNIMQENIPRNLPRLPWHDVSLMLVGQSVKDVTKHFVQYWNFANFENHHQQRQVLTVQPHKLSRKVIEKKLDEGIRKIRQFATNIKQIILPHQEQNSPRQSNTENANNVHSDKEKSRANPGRTALMHWEKETITEKRLNQEVDKGGMTRFAVQEIRCSFAPTNQPSDSNLEQLEHKNSLQKSEFPYEGECRMKPDWEDLPALQNIVMRISKPDEEDIDEIEKAYEQHSLNMLHNKNKKNIQQDLKSEPDYIHEDPVIQKRHSLISIPASSESIPFQKQLILNSICQIVRSVSHWAIGCNPTHKEQSIQFAYVRMISEARRFIYIENQFFISAVQNSTEIKNQIAEALFQRIKFAIEKKHKFKVFILIPLVPGFAGELDDSAATVPRLVMHWQYRTICRHPNSLLSRLKKITDRPEQYIQFYGLRQHGVIQNKPITEIIYLHSKLMIVDDQRAICGSANINDRSMQGKRDSQICCIVQGGKPKQIKIEGGSGKIQVSDKIHQLRMKLWKEHFLTQECEDPLNQSLFRRIRSQAKKNTQIYRQLFGCYPDDSILNLGDLNSLKRTPTMAQYQEKKSSIIGHVVEFPLKFLKKENLTVGSTLYPKSIPT